MLVDSNGGALRNGIGEDQFADTVLDIVLDGTLQGTCAKLHVIALGGHKYLSGIAELYLIAHIADALEDAFQFDIDDTLDSVEVELVEGDNLVETVEELGRELF